MNQVFDLKRTMLLAGFKFNLHKRFFLLSVTGYFALLLIIGFFIAYANRNDANTFEFYSVFHYIAMPILMVLGSIIFAGRSFQDMNTREKSTLQIMIPASTFEKYMLNLISTSILWLIFSFVAYHIFSLLFNGMWTAVYGYKFELFNGFDIFKIHMTKEIVLGYFLAHSIYLLGAASFQKYPIVKTILTQFIIHWIFSLLGFIVILILFGSSENFGLNMNNLEKILIEKEWFTPENVEYYSRLILRTGTIILTLALYVTGFYKLKEREV